MTLIQLVLLPLGGGLVAGIAGRYRDLWARVACLVTLAWGLGVTLWLGFRAPGTGTWLAEIDLPWIPALSVRLHLAMDGITLPLVVLTYGMGLVAVIASWEEIQERVGFFHLNLMAILSGVIGVFLSLDLVLFYFFWELMLVPMYLLIGIWGHERRLYAAVKFFLFTQASGLMLLLAILGLYFAHGVATGTPSFDYEELVGTPLAPALETWLMLGFFAAFAVKLPMFPFHTWLPDAHTEAPTAGSVILAALMLKTGGYGMIRFLVPLFPEAAGAFAEIFMGLGAAGVIYGAWLAFAQTDAKRLVAYTSVSHLGFVVIAVFAWNEIALQGALFEMICHGLSTGALFVVVAMVKSRTHTRDLTKLGGMWTTMPRFGAAALFFALAALGLPGLGNFIAEFMCLLGAFQAEPAVAVVAGVGLVAAAIYSLWLMQKTFFGPPGEGVDAPDLRGWEVGLYAAMAVVLVWLGLNPQPVFDTAAHAIDLLVTTVEPL